MTEEQRRALFALREALRLCEGAQIAVDAVGAAPVRLWVGVNAFLLHDYLIAAGVHSVIEAHPE